MPVYHPYKNKPGGYFRGRSRSGYYYTEPESEGCLSSGTLRSIGLLLLLGLAGLVIQAVLDFFTYQRIVAISEVAWKLSLGLCIPTAVILLLVTILPPHVHESLRGLKATASSLVLRVYDDVREAAKPVTSRNEYGEVFDRQISETRIEFLERVFGLTEGELRFLHFDGFSFYPGEAIPYARLTRVMLKSSHKIEADHSRSPSRTTYQHMHADGVPDPQYSENRKTLHTDRVELSLVRFVGTARLVTYVRPSLASDMTFEPTLKKINDMLRTWQPIDLESCYKSYHQARQSATALNQELELLYTAQSKLRETQAARDQLKMQGQQASTSDEAVDLDAQFQSLRDAIDEKHRIRMATQADIGSLIESIQEAKAKLTIPGQ